MNIENKLTDFFIKDNNININQDFKLEWIRARDLIVPERIDLIAKIKYIEHKEKGYNLDYAKSLYTATIEAFSFGTFVEPGNDKKNSIKAYFETFDSLIDTIKNNGVNKEISIVPVGKDNVILDGAHRTAISAYFDLEIPIIRFNDLYVNYGIEYFRKKFVAEKYLDYLTVEYCKMKSNVYVACLWPIAEALNKTKEVEEILNSNVKIVASKKIKLTFNGISNLMTEAYFEQKWTGSYKNNFSGVFQKANACYNKNGLLNVYVLETENFKDILSLKAKIRDVYKLDKHSIHITDNQSETKDLSEILFNDNSVHLINNGKPYKYEEINVEIKKFKNKIYNNKYDFDEFVIDSSSVMAIYGLRYTKDVDFLTFSKGFADNYFDDHEDYLIYHNKSKSELILDPSNYLFYKGIKFITLSNLKDFKKNRNEKKDQLDFRVISSFLKNSKSLKQSYIKSKIEVKRLQRNLIIKFKKKVKKTGKRISRKLGLYSITRKVYIYLKER